MHILADIILPQNKKKRKPCRKIFARRAGMAGFKFVQGADVIVFALTRSIRYVVPIVENGTGNPSSTRYF